MKPTLIISTITLAILLLLISACSTTNSQTICVQDSDCVPALCCHATSSVNKEFAPDCQGQLCSMECSPGTLDCGQGKIKCLEQECRIVLYDQ